MKVNVRPRARKRRHASQTDVTGTSGPAGGRLLHSQGASIAVIAVLLLFASGCNGNESSGVRDTPSSVPDSSANADSDPTEKSETEDLQGVELPSELQSRGVAGKGGGQYKDHDGYVADVNFTIFNAIPLTDAAEGIVDFCPPEDGYAFSEVASLSERRLEGGYAQAFSYTLTSPDPQFPFPWREYVADAEESLRLTKAWLGFTGNLYPPARPSVSCVAEESETSVTWIGMATVLPTAKATPDNPDASLEIAPTDLTLSDPLQELSSSMTEGYRIVESPEDQLIHGWSLDDLIDDDLFDSLIAGESLEVPSASSSTTAQVDPCITAYPGGERTTSSTLFGETVSFDAEESRFAVCAGFGMSEPASTPSNGMKCALIASVAVYAGPPGTHSKVSDACTALSVAESFESGDWAKSATGYVCGVLSDMFAAGTGVAAAGVSSATGPGAVAVGVSTYKALAAGGEVACAALGDAYDWGVQIQTEHEANLAADVVHRGKCLRQTTFLGQLFWSTTDC